ncbi:MAG: hypothetical protein HYT73_00075 [Candidatus Aenigmarchaeota archaeon]|nr:hypothetical protein [Candidatus Aenigmarchaeota archaeon]
MGHEAGLGVHKRLLTDALLHHLGGTMPDEQVLMLSAGVGRYLEVQCEYVGIIPAAEGGNMDRFWKFIECPGVPYRMDSMRVYHPELDYVSMERNVFLTPLYVRNEMRQRGIEFEDYPDQRDGNPRSPEEVEMIMPYYAQESDITAQ